MIEGRWRGARGGRLDTVTQPGAISECEANVQNKVQIVYVPVPVAHVPRPQRLTSVYEIHCPACGHLSEHLDLKPKSCPKCWSYWGKIEWQQPVLEDDRPAVCENPDCPHA